MQWSYKLMMWLKSLLKLDFLFKTLWTPSDAKAPWGKAVWTKLCRVLNLEQEKGKDRQFQVISLVHLSSVETVKVVSTIWLLTRVLSTSLEDRSWLLHRSNVLWTAELSIKAIRKQKHRTFSTSLLMKNSIAHWQKVRSKKFFKTHFIRSKARFWRMVRLKNSQI